ncbi:phosphopantetheinyl transferase [Sporormia fimetaria CBS 119925]|uniref:holo-[acyl-carrier-protein] synthase n=1 Tax=Sporormia fimetaria CBS 119925 TaxID=1340428 RepID=A0A6A6V9C3_9PLEO|nr:phosphopantetheinyl transferase [Sporormia fimetaria CBS 119925]
MTRGEQTSLTCWLVDTRSLWPGDNIESAAPEALQLLSEEERETCTRKFRIQDARMSLASALLKRLFVSKTLDIPWKDVKFSRQGDPKHGKPCAVLSDGSETPVEFNVSHQAGLVALVGCRTDTHKVQLGVDIVCVNERNDYRIVDAQGLHGWLDMYKEIFSQAELEDMKYNVDTFLLNDGTEVTPDQLGPHIRCTTMNENLTATLPTGEKRTFQSDLLIEAKLRRFYTYWCYKEAYIKLDGEALLAPWLSELEFRNVHAPPPGTAPRCGTLGSWGERRVDTEVWMKGMRLDDVRIEIQSYEENYMISVAAKPAPVLPEVLTAFESLNLEEEAILRASGV